MHEYRRGFLVRSNAGHDKGKLYVIKAVEEEYVFLVDGKIRTMHKPKKKKIKHIGYISDTLFIEDACFNDDKIKRIIKQMGNELR